MNLETIEMKGKRNQCRYEWCDTYECVLYCSSWIRLSMYGIDVNMIQSSDPEREVKLHSLNTMARYSHLYFVWESHEHVTHFSSDWNGQLLVFIWFQMFTSPADITMVHYKQHVYIHVQSKSKSHSQCERCNQCQIRVLCLRFSMTACWFMTQKQAPFARTQSV